MFDNTRRSATTRDLAGLRVGRTYAVMMRLYEGLFGPAARGDSPSMSERDATSASFVVDATTPADARVTLVFSVVRAGGRPPTNGWPGGAWTLYDVTRWGECTEMGC